MKRDLSFVAYVLLFGLIWNASSIMEAAGNFYEDVFLGRTGLSSELSHECDKALSAFPPDPKVNAVMVGASRTIIDGQFLPITRDIVLTSGKEGLSAAANGFSKVGVDHDGNVRAVGTDGREIIVSTTQRQKVSSGPPPQRDLSIEMNCIGVTPEGAKFFAKTH